MKLYANICYQRGCVDGYGQIQLLPYNDCDKSWPIAQWFPKENWTRLIQVTVCIFSLSNN